MLNSRHVIEFQSVGGKMMRRNFSAFFTTATFFLVASMVVSQRPPSGCSAAEHCISEPPYKNVTITTDSNYRYVTTTECPPYKNPQWTNPSYACTRHTTYKIPLHPKLPTTASSIPVGEWLEYYERILYLKEDPPPILGPLGVLTNGVNLFGVGSPCGFSSKCPENGGPSKYVDAVSSEGHTTDQCGGHADPNHNYHVHSQTGFNASKPNGRRDCVLAEDTPGEHSKLLGWMFDGFGIYGQFSENGAIPKDLDECGGHTHDIDGVSVYHYHFPYPSQFPWSIGCFKGCPEISNNQHEFSGFTKYGC